MKSDIQNAIKELRKMINKSHPCDSKVSALKIAISALEQWENLRQVTEDFRQELERQQQPCDYCRTDNKRQVIRKSTWTFWCVDENDNLSVSVDCGGECSIPTAEFDINFCPNCGRNLIEA